MPCKIPVVTIFLIGVLVLPIGLTFAFGAALYGFPKMVLGISIGFHGICIFIHGIAIVTFYIQRYKEGQPVNSLAMTCVTILLVVFQAVFCTFGIVVSAAITSHKGTVMCNQNDANDTIAEDANGNTVYYLNRECSLELYFFFGALLTLIFRLPTILWGLCDRRFLTTPGSTSPPYRRRVYTIRPPTSSSSYPEAPSMPPPPAYNLAFDAGSLDDSKLPTYDQALSLPA